MFIYSDGGTWFKKQNDVIFKATHCLQPITDHFEVRYQQVPRCWEGCWLHLVWRKNQLSSAEEIQNTGERISAFIEMFFFTCNTDPWLKLSNKSCSYMTMIPHILKKSLDQTRISVPRTLPVFMNKSLSVPTCLANSMKPSQTILCWVLNVELLYLLFFFSLSRNRQVKMPQPRGW